MKLSDACEMYVFALEETKHSKPGYKAEKLKEKLKKGDTYGQTLPFCSLNSGGKFKLYIVYNSVSSLLITTMSNEDTDIDSMITTFNAAVTETASEILGKPRQGKKSNNKKKHTPESLQKLLICATTFFFFFQLKCFTTV